MNRRETISAIAALSALTSVALAQQAKFRRVGYLVSGSEIGAKYYEAFRDGLREAGWVEGNNVVVDRRFAEGSFERLPVLAAELVRLKVAVLVAGATPAAVAAKNATSTIPIVMWGVADPVVVGLIGSAARPGGNVTGVSFAFGTDLYSKELQLLKEVVPTARRVAVLSNSENPGHVLAVKSIRDAGEPLNLSLHLIKVATVSEFEDAFVSMVKDRVDAVLVVPDSLFGSYARQLAALATKYRLPSMFGLRSNAEAGGLASYGPNLSHQNRQAAGYVDRILRGAKPADLPVEQPSKFELVINLKTATALGVTIPQALLLRVDDKIE
jgi:putative ABC transport system substrate-binding protein